MDEQELAHEREAPEREANPEKRRKLFAGASTTTYTKELQAEGEPRDSMAEDEKVKAEKWLESKLKPARGKGKDPLTVRAAIIMAQNPRRNARAAMKDAGLKSDGGHTRVNELHKEINKLNYKEDTLEHLQTLVREEDQRKRQGSAALFTLAGQGQGD